MASKVYGRFTDFDAPQKNSTKINTVPYTNNLTRRNQLLAQHMPTRAPSTSLISANIKSLRLFRHICRLIPFILKTQQLTQRVTPVQSKRYVANWFRKNAELKYLDQIDYLIKYGYEVTYEAEMLYCNSGYLYRYLAPPTHKYRDFGVDRFYDKKADRINQEPDSKFLEGFYRGRKSHVI